MITFVNHPDEKPPVLSYRSYPEYPIFERISGFSQNYLTTTLGDQRYVVSLDRAHGDTYLLVSLVDPSLALGGTLRRYPVSSDESLETILEQMPGLLLMDQL